MLSTYCIVQNFDGYWLFKYLTEMVTVFHYTPVNAKEFDELNIDGLAGKRQNFACHNFALYGISMH